VGKRDVERAEKHQNIRQQNAGDGMRCFGSDDNGRRGGDERGARLGVSNRVNMRYL
jgi:hypothetical protein